MYFLSWYPTRSYPAVMIGLFICYLLDPISSWAILSTWSLIFSWPLVRWKLKCRHYPLNASSILTNFGSQSGYQLIDNHRSDPTIRTKLSDFIFGLIVDSSSCSASFFIDVMGLVMSSIGKDHPMPSIFVLYMLISHRWITRLSMDN
jgi:hypothetical protein